MSHLCRAIPTDFSRGGVVVVELLRGHVHGFPPGVEGGGREGGRGGRREGRREDVLGAFGFGGPATGAFGLGGVVVELAFGAGPVAFVDGVGGTQLAVVRVMVGEGVEE